MRYAPIALFVYNRLQHAQQTIYSLQKNALAKLSDLYIYSDGAKDPACQANVDIIRAWLKTVKGFKSIRIIERDRNYGLANSIIDGVTTLVTEFGKVIVMEDDLLVSPFYLDFMNDGLVFYQEEEQVASIHGYALPLREPVPETYFLRGADCWGWATWKRAWDKFESNGTKLLSLLQQNNLIKQFDYDFTQPNIQMLKDQIMGKNNSWAIRWHASTFIHNMLTLYPGKSLVKNIGLDNSGEHCVSTSIFDVQIFQDPILIEPIAIEKNNHAYEAYVRFFKNARETFFKKLMRKAKKLFSVKVDTQHA